MRRERKRLLFLVVVAVLGVALHGFGQPSGKTKISATVTYVTPGTVYLGAGSKAGLQTGDTLTVIHGGVAAGQVIITAVSSTSSAASVQGPAASAAVGDTVFILKTIGQIPAPPAASTSARSRREGGISPGTDENTVSGRVAMQYAGAGVFGHAMDFSQPALLLRLGVDRLLGTGLTFTFYGRTYYDLSDQFAVYGLGSRFSTRIYEMSVTYDNAAAPFGYTFGRLISPFLGGLGQFDGGQLYYRSGGLSAGFAAGTQADPRNSALTLDYQKGAAFANYAWGGDIFTKSDITLAYGQQLYKGKFDRDFVYTQASIRPTQKIMFYESSEFDVHDINNGVRISRFHLTSAFATLSYMANDWLTLNAGYDATRVIYLFESMKAFPDSLINRELQKGIRTGFTLRLPLRMLIMTSATFRPTNEAKNAHTLNATLRMSDIASSGLNAGAMYTNTISLYTRGSGTALDLDRWISAAVIVGARLDQYWYTIAAGNQRLSTTTLTVNTNLRLSQALYLLVNFDQIWDTLRRSQRAYVEFGFRF